MPEAIYTCRYIVTSVPTSGDCKMYQLDDIVLVDCNLGTGPCEPAIIIVGDGDNPCAETVLTSWSDECADWGAWS